MNQPTLQITTFLGFFFALIPNLKSEYRAIERIHIKIATGKERLFFLRRCCEEKVIPQTMSWLRKINLDVPFPKEALEYIKKAMSELQEEINLNFFKLRKRKNAFFSEVDNFRLESQLRRCFREVSDNYRVKKKAELKKKLQKLIIKSPWSKYSIRENVVNKSSFLLKSNHLDLLGYGLNFAMPHEKHNLFTFVEHLEKNKNAPNDISYNCIFMNLDQIFQSLKSDLNDFFPKRFRVALCELKREKSIRICKADKGSKIVIVNKNDYNLKMYSLLNDTKVYKKIVKNPLKKMQSQFNSGLKRISEKYGLQNLKKFESRLPSLPYIYGQPKIHKKDVPLRPIVSIVNCPKYRLSKWLTKELSSLLGCFSNSHIKHNIDLLNRLKYIKPGNQKFISFDVSSLYTNVPIKHTINFLKRKMPTLNLDLNMPLDCYLELIELCLQNSFFQFEGTFYEQIYGLAMGCPLSSFLANMFLEHVESELLPRYKGVNPTFWCRYVDDILSLVPSNFILEDFLKFINNLYPTLSFTHEWEIEQKIPFLDVLIYNLKTKLNFSVYRKPTNSEGYLHFFSHSALYIKSGLAQSLFLRALRVCSPEYLDFEINHIFASLQKLAYPKHILNKSLKKARRTFYRNNVSDGNKNVRKNNIVVPYIPSLEKIKQPLHQLGTNLVFKYDNKLSHNLVKNKPKINNEAGVYKIPCKSCDKSYIGETGRSLKKRITEHKKDIVLQKYESGVAEHVRETDHFFDFQNAKIVYPSNNTLKRHIIESTLISTLQKTDKTCNLNLGFAPHNVFLTKHLKEIIHLDDFD